MTKNKTTPYSFDHDNHIHKWDNKPLFGATTLIGEVMPPPLAYHGSGKACQKLGWYDRKQRANYLPDSEGMPILEKKLSEIKKMTATEYLNLLDKAYMAHKEYASKRATEGTNTHKKIENAVKDAILTNNGYLKDSYDDELEEFVKWGKGKKFLASEVHVASEKIYVGGIIDLVYEDDGIYIGDVKTSKGFYPSQVIQQGLYDYCQAENGFLTDKGVVVGTPKEIKGYTIIKVGKDVKTKTYYNTERMREFASNLSELYQTIQKLEEFIK